MMAKTPDYDTTEDHVPERFDPLKDPAVQATYYAICRAEGIVPAQLNGLDHDQIAFDAFLIVERARARRGD